MNVKSVPSFAFLRGFLRWWHSVCVFGSSYLRPNRGLDEERHDRRTHDRHLGGLVTTPKNLP